MLNGTIVGLLLILCISQGGIWYLQLNAEPVQVAQPPNFKALLGRSPRLGGVAHYWKSKLSPFNQGPAKDYLFEMHKNVVGDFQDARYYLALGEQSMSISASGQFLYRDRWHVVYEADQSDIVASFGDDSLLVMNLEQIKFPQCKVSEDPVVVYLELIDKKANLAPIGVTLVHGIKGWRIRMNVASETDLSNLNRRVLAKRGCIKQATSK